jgi:hypothetical protein
MPCLCFNFQVIPQVVLCRALTSLLLMVGDPAEAPRELNGLGLERRQKLSAQACVLHATGMVMC